MNDKLIIDRIENLEKKFIKTDAALKHVCKVFTELNATNTEIKEVVKELLKRMKEK